MCYHDIYPDRAELRDYSVASLFPDYISGSKNHDEWEAIGVWAWGSSRIVDYLEREGRIDMSKIAIMGHSRQGKAALWSGAQDSKWSYRMILVVEELPCQKEFMGKILLA